MLQRHVQFFDSDKDGFLDRVDIYQGLRALRFNRVVSWLGSWLLPLSLGKKSGGTYQRISIAGIDNTAHQPDDTGGFTERPLLALTQATYTKDDIRELIRRRGGKPRLLSFTLEWQTLFSCLNKFRPLKNEHGQDVISQEELRYVFDGTLFYRLTGRPVPT
jgi:hypothetical protein